jgi:hypothetical protein
MQRRLTPAPNWAVGVLAVAVLVLVALAALGARGLPGSEMRPPPFAIDFDLLAVARIVLGILAGFGALLLILLLLPGGPPIELPERKKSSTLGMLAGIALLFAVLLLLQPLFNRTEEELPLAEKGDAATTIEIPGNQPSGSRWGLIILGGAILLVVFGVAAATRAIPDEPEPETTDPPVALQGVIDSVLAELENSDDPRKVVIGAYARMERVFTAAGLPPRRSEAPLEYLARSLRDLDIGRPAVGRLTRLFEVARFSDHQILPELAIEAVAALRDIRNELSGAAS